MSWQERREGKRRPRLTSRAVEHLGASLLLLCQLLAGLALLVGLLGELHRLLSFKR